MTRRWILTPLCLFLLGLGIGVGDGWTETTANPMGRPLTLIPLSGEQIPVSPVSAWSKLTPDATFHLSTSRVKSLPAEMYGTWSIIATVIDTNAPPWFFTPSVTEIWTLERSGGEITLQNVITQAVASVQVDQVQGKTATFHHAARDSRRELEILETPTLTVNGDRLSGTNHQEVVLLKRGQPFKHYTLNIQVEGSRLSGAKVSFGPEDIGQTPFEVAPLQFEDHP